MKITLILVLVAFLAVPVCAQTRGPVTDLELRQRWEQAEAELLNAVEQKQRTLSACVDSANALKAEAGWQVGQPVPKGLLDHAGVFKDDFQVWDLRIVRKAVEKPGRIQGQLRRGRKIPTHIIQTAIKNQHL